LLVSTESYFEGEVKKLSVFNWDGSRLCDLSFLGSIHILERSHRVLLAQESAHYRVDESLILDPDCNVVARVRQPESVVGFGVSKDEKLFWVISHEVADGEMETRASVYDLSGKKVAEKDVDHAGSWTFDHLGERYTIALPAPDYPG